MDEKEKMYRQYRNDFLKATDWTQISDCTVDKQAWATYRQALRDLPDQSDFPHKIVWPVRPDHIDETVPPT
jgi:hypothetical protein